MSVSSDGTVLTPSGIKSEFDVDESRGSDLEAEMESQREASVDEESRKSKKKEVCAFPLPHRILTPLTESV